MSDTLFLEKCKAYIDCHLQATRSSGDFPKPQLPAITISRETGAGGISIADRLAAYLEEHGPRTPCPWTVFHKNLVQRVLEEHNLPARLAQFMPEDKVSSITDAMEELLGLHPPSSSLVRQLTETILQLAELGNAILVGRGANFITARMPHVFHVRLVGSLEKRVARVEAFHAISRHAALAFIRKEDAGRRRYIRRYFKQDIGDPLAYHLILNTDWLSTDEAAELIGRPFLGKFSALRATR